MSLPLTPSQTIGPFFAHALPWPDGPYVVPEHTPGAVWVRGRLTDGEGQPLDDALVETWQADPRGHFPHPDDPRPATGGFRGFGRCPTDGDGAWAVLTLKPGCVLVPGGGMQAPHLDVAVFARGLMQHLVTRVYFPDEPEANAADPVLGVVADTRARASLVAAAAPDGYRFDIRLQGADETCFFAV